MLTIDNGSQLSISCVGSMLSNSMKDSTRPIALYDILLVHTITKYKQSEFAVDNYVIVEFNSSCFHVKDKVSKATLLKCFLHNGLYLSLPVQLHTNLPQSSNNSSTGCFFNTFNYYLASTIRTSQC